MGKLTLTREEAERIGLVERRSYAQPIGNVKTGVNAYEKSRLERKTGYERAERNVKERFGIHRKKHNLWY